MKGPDISRRQVLGVGTGLGLLAIGRGVWSLTNGPQLRANGQQTLHISWSEVGVGTGRATGPTDDVVDTTPPTARIEYDRPVVAGVPTTFSGLESSDASGITSYQWEFGDGSSDSGGRVVHTYEEPGTYRLSLSVTDASGNEGTAVSRVTVFPPEDSAGSSSQSSQTRTTDTTSDDSDDSDDDSPESTESFSIHVDGPGVSVDDVMPGDSGGKYLIELQTSGSPATISVDGFVENWERGITEPERAAGDSSGGQGGGELQDRVRINLWNDNGTAGVIGSGNGNRDFGESIIEDGVLSDLTSLDGATVVECLSPDTTHRLAFEWWLPEDVGNDVQTDEVQFSLRFTGESCSE